MEIGSSPNGEDCVQVGTPEYYDWYRKEMTAHINRIRRHYGPEPEGAKLIIKRFPHDYGEYHEVVCYFNTPGFANRQTDASCDYAFDIESDLKGVLEYWDEEAKQELGAEYFKAIKH